jgi:signal transduction histidine kinase
LATGEPSEVVVTVHNEGPPIAKALQSTIFDPLMRGVVREWEDRSHRGSLGLGLYISREIARAHGGDIGVSSSAEAGTTFKVRLAKDAAPQRLA